MFHFLYICKWCIPWSSEKIFLFSQLDTSLKSLEFDASIFYFYSLLMLWNDIIYQAWENIFKLFLVTWPRPNHFLYHNHAIPFFLASILIILKCLKTWSRPVRMSICNVLALFILALCVHSLIHHFETVFLDECIVLI